MSQQQQDYINKAFQLSDLRDYSWDKSLQIRAIARAAYWMIGLMARTIRLETEGAEHYEELVTKGQKPVWVLWHDRLFLST